LLASTILKSCIFRPTASIFLTRSVIVTYRHDLPLHGGGLCAAERLYYVTTAGGAFFPEEYGFGYVRALAESFYGIKDCRLIKAVGLDIWGADEEKILADCENEIASL